MKCPLCSKELEDLPSSFLSKYICSESIDHTIYFTSEDNFEVFYEDLALIRNNNQCELAIGRNWMSIPVFEFNEANKVIEKVLSLKSFY